MKPGENHKVPPGGVLIPTERKPWFHQEHYLLRRGKTTVGRATDCDVRIDHPAISRVHAELFWSGGTLLLTHLSPVNPTLVNGVPVTDQRRLRTGDRIELSEGVEFRVEIFDNDDDTPTLPRQDQRRMYAIVHADVVSYSRLVESDDTAAAHQLEGHVELIRDESERAGGHIKNVAGDAILALFTSAYSAVTSAIGWQQKINSLNRSLPQARRMEFRVGINSGDVLITPAGNVYGDAINIAARIQSMGSPGGILVAGVVRDQLQGHENVVFEYVKRNELRNLSRAIRIYAVKFS